MKFPKISKPLNHGNFDIDPFAAYVDGLLDALKIGTNNVYRVNSALAWQDRAEVKWAAFNARLVVNFEEQDSINKRLVRERIRHIPFVQKDDADFAPVLGTHPAPAGE